MHLALPGSVSSNDVDCHRPTPELIRELTDWIAAHTEYDVAKTIDPPPEIRFCAVGEDVDYLSESALVEPGDRALYDMDRRRIYLVQPWRATDPLDVEVLLHELIHDVQFQNRSWECPNATEWQAYKLQEEWLEQRGVEFDFDWLAIYMRARCPRDIHP